MVVDNYRKRVVDAFDPNMLSTAYDECGDVT